MLLAGETTNKWLRGYFWMADAALWITEATVILHMNVFCQMLHIAVKDAEWTIMIPKYNKALCIPVLDLTRNLRVELENMCDDQKCRSQNPV